MPALLDESPLRKSRVFRQRWQAGQEVHAFIVKRFSSERACVERRALQRWLMAAGMDAVAPRLLAVVTEERAEAVWLARGKAASNPPQMWFLLSAENQGGRCCFVPIHLHQPAGKAGRPGDQSVKRVVWR